MLACCCTCDSWLMGYCTYNCNIVPMQFCLSKLSESKSKILRFILLCLTFCCTPFNCLFGCAHCLMGCPALIGNVKEFFSSGMDTSDFRKLIIP
mmetsp:Transcript_101810/g.152536  ORF Transcript_101810/g.152536 Transcript_101810/m.152536 type:complete len:94 (+) Transcript_101810:86-367(+)